ncbi:MAG: helix-turn-helix transcriptional regulator [Anaerostipes sp.]|nr:helix-turn-helix transcriptional regulator [Anaerostipes sp.]
MGLEKINEYKKKLGYTTDELSNKSGVPIGTLNKILSGATKDPKLETLKSISRVLGLTLDDFDDKPITVAAHLSGTEDLSEAEIDDVNKYIEFIKNKRK